MINHFFPSGSLICVKEFAYGSPKLHAIFETHATFLNANIKSNFDLMLQAGFNSPEVKK